MHSQNKFNLLLIHDDGRAFKFRISGRTMQFGIVASLVLILGGICGIWFGSVLWQENRKLNRIERNLQQEMAELNVQVERLQNMELLYKRSKSQTAETYPIAVISPEPIAADEDDDLPPDTHPETIHVMQRPDIMANPDLSEINTKAVRVVNMSVRISSERTLISMDLHNDTQSQLSGNAVFSFISENGDHMPLSYEDQYFRISRFKKVVATTTLPATGGNISNAALLVEIKSSDGTLMFRKLYPFTSSP